MGTGCETRRYMACGDCLAARLYYHRRAVREHFRDALHHFGRVVTGADYRISAQFRGVLQHQVESLGPGLLAQLGQQSDIATENSLQTGPDGAENRA